jgi:hypothetical protein
VSILDILQENALSDNELLQKNDAMGDVFDRPRDVDFAFKTDDREKANVVCEYINGTNFGNARVDETADGVYWVIVVIFMPINQNLLCAVSGFMACLGRLFAIEYDGWGSVIQEQ